MTWNYKSEQWKILLALLPISAALIGSYIWIQVKIVYDGPARFIRPPTTARSARRKRTAAQSANHVSPVTIYAHEVYTNSCPDRHTERQSGSAKEQHFYSVAYNGYGPVIPNPEPVGDNKPSSYNYPHLRVIPPTPAPDIIK